MYLIISCVLALLAGLAGSPARAATANFVKIDSTTVGNWIGVYGADGYNVSQDPYIKTPAYASVSFTGDQTAVWAFSSTASAGLQRPEAPTRYIAATWYGAPQFTINVNLTDGQPHQVALYALDWECGTCTARSETINVLDAATGAILDSRVLPAGSFQSGEYVVFSVQGNVRFQIVYDSSGTYPHSVISGIFFDKAPGIPFFQGFETNSNGVNPAQCGGTTKATLTTYAYSSCTGCINAPNASFGKKFAIATPDNSQWGCAMNSYFGGVPNPSNGDFIAPPYQPYQGIFTQSIALYIPVSGTGAWAPPANTGNAAFELNEDPNVLDMTGSPNYGLESNILFSVPSAGTVQIGWTGDANYLAAGQNTFAIITQSGWYTIAVTYMRAGNGTTDPPLQVISVYDSSGNLLGATAIPCGDYLPSGCPSQSSGLLGSDQLDLAYFQHGWQPAGIAVDNVQTYLGVPNSSTAPVISNSGTYSGMHGVPFSLQIRTNAGNTPTAYGAAAGTAVGTSSSPALPAGLSINTSTGLISGTPTTPGTYYVVLFARNGTGAGAALVKIAIL